MSLKELISTADYRKYLIQKFGGAGRRTGQRAQFAKHLGVQTAFVSQVLNLSTGIHLNLEQAARANSFLEHDEEEGHLFLLLVQKQRAGTTELKIYFKKQIEAIEERHQQIKSRVPAEVELTPLHQALYYSQWFYSAIHILLTIPEFRSRRAIAEALTLDLGVVTEALNQLVEMGLAARTTEGFTVGPQHIHLAANSPFIGRHHANWRIQAMKSFDTPMSNQKLHYSSVLSFAKRDIEKLRSRILKMIEETLAEIKPSKEEVLYTINVDFFPVLDQTGKRSNEDSN